MSPNIGKLLRRVALVAAVVALPVGVWAVSTCADIARFYWIDDRLATGGQQTMEQFASLKREGFRTIINLREPSEHDAGA